MNRSEARFILLELLRRSEARKPLPPIDWKSLVSPEQWQILLDPAKDKVLCCPRQKGKTEGGSFYLLKTAYENPGVSCLYLALTRKSAKNLIWRTLKKSASKLGIPYVAAESELTITIGTSVIYVLGADQEMIAERLRGLTFMLIVVDEIGSFRSDTRYLIDDVLSACLLKHNGTMLLQGTPPPTWEDDDLFYEAWFKDTEYKKFTITKNPFIPHWEAWVEKLRLKRKWTLDNPTYRREYCGEWVKDLESLVWKFDSGRNKHSVLPENLHPEYILGIDLGFVDATAFVVLAVYPTLKKIFVTECYQHTEMIVSSIATDVKLLTNKYKPVISVADTGGGGRTVVEELNQVHHLAIKAADKTNKKGYIEMLNAAMIQGQVSVDEHLVGLINELQTLQWDSTKKKDIASGSDDHRSHAFLYAFREAARLISPLSGEIVDPKKDLTAEEFEAKMEALDKEAYDKEQQEQKDLLNSDEEEWGLFSGNS